MYYALIIGANNDKITNAVQLQQLELGKSAFQAKVNSVQQYNRTLSSADMVLGLPTDSLPPRTRFTATTSSSSSAPATMCHECSSSDIDSSNSSMESCGKKGAATCHGSREKDLKDYAYSKALIDFKV